MQNLVVEGLQRQPNKPQLRIDNLSADSATIYAYGPIGADFYDGVSELEFAKAVAGISAPTLNIRINSPGGDVFAARAMTAAIRGFSGEVVAHIDGVAASAASWLALAADKVVMNSGALMMIHQASTFTYGNANDLANTMAVLNMMDDLMAADYSAKAPATAPAAFLELMAAETWFTAEAALELGLIDSITEARPPAGGSTPTNLATVYAKAPVAAVATAEPAQITLDAGAESAKACRDRFANYLKLGRV